MTPSQKYTFTLAAGAAQRLQVVGQFFRLISVTGAVKVQSETINLDALLTGDGIERTPFQWLQITDQSGAANTITIVVSDSAFLNAPVTNTVVTATKAPQAAGVTHTTWVIGPSSGSIASANTARQYLLIQNNSSTATIWVKFGAAAVTSANGIRIGPGAYFEWAGVIPTSLVNGIADAASTNLVVVEG
jgi:hypothetical protein